MSSTRFESFSEIAAAAGASWSEAEALAAYLMKMNRGARLLPARAASDLGLDRDRVEELFEIAALPEASLLEEAPRAQCRSCGEWVDSDYLEGEIASEGVAACPDCDAEIKADDGLLTEMRYRLTVEADAEAVAHQARHVVMRAVIITALRLELKEVHRQLESLGEVSEERAADDVHYFRAQSSGQHVDWEVYAAASGVGNEAAAATTLGAMLTVQPDLVILCGIAGGIEEKGVALGDVVVADTVHNYEGGKETGAGLQPRTIQLRSSFGLQQLAQQVMIKGAWRERILGNDPAAGSPAVHLEPIATGSKVVASRQSTTYRLIRGIVDRAVAVEMEGSGFLLAAERFGGVDRVVIRGISDLVSEKGKTDDEGWQPRAAANAAAFTLALLDAFLPKPSP